MRTVCVGDCGVDHYLPSGPLICGGISSNFARQTRSIAPAEDEIVVISAVGDDGDPASLARRAVERPGFQCDIVTLPGSTPVQFIEIEADGERNFVRYEEGVLKGFRMAERHRKLIASADLLVAPVFRQIRELFDSILASPRSALTAVDFADFASHPDFDHLQARLGSIDIAFFGLSIEQRAEIDALRELAARHGKLLIVTLGADGCHAFDGDEQYRRDADPVSQVVDTTGAGDAFAAGFLNRLVHGSEIDHCLDSGAALAAKTVQKQGAVPDLMK